MFCSWTGRQRDSFQRVRGSVSRGKFPWMSSALYANGQLESPWVRSTDADVWVPPDYWTRTLPSGDGSALWMAYEHVGEGGESQESAMMEYEIYLHYHSLGLQSAGSPYPFPCIGSTLWIHVEKYAAVRGFPKKEAGEDFYLLNKLAKWLLSARSPESG